MFSGKVIFIAPLDWGLGHATRCVPIIRRLEKQNTVILGVTPVVKKIFDEEFPQLRQVELPSYNISYSSWLPLWMKLGLEWPRIVSVIREEQKLLLQIVHAHKIDVVISDSRFGLFARQVHTVFISHQVFLKTPFAGAIAQRRNKGYISNFNELWIPDHEREEESLSGELSHGGHFHPRITYIGPQTRLQKADAEALSYDYLFLLSGPEPQHSLLRERLAELAAMHPGLNFALVSGAPALLKSDNLETVILPDKQRLSELIAKSGAVVCRSGYSTLMDLHALGRKKLVLIPTPGQTEQEYLAGYWKEKFKAEVVKQEDLLKTHLHPAR